MKELVYSKNIICKNLFVGLQYKDLTIQGRVYKEIKNRLFRKPKIKYTYTISTPFIDKPFYDGEFSTNKILSICSEYLKQQLIDKIQELKENY